MQMNQVIVTSKEELEILIKVAIRQALGEQTENSVEKEHDKILSIQEASVFLNLAKQTLYSFTSKNIIPFLKKGKKLYFRKSDLINWLSEGKQKSKSEILKDII
jgi:excisionase family DNA binding protein